MSGAFKRYKPLIRLAAVLACTYCVFELTYYLWLNSPGVASERMARGNAEIVSRVAVIYAKSDWNAVEPLPTLDDTTLDDETTLAAATPEAPRHCDCFCPDD